MRLLLWQVMARRVAGTGSGCSIRFTIRPVSRYAFRSSWVTLRASSQTVRINSPSVVRIVLVLVVMGNTSFYGPSARSVPKVFSKKSRFDRLFAHVCEGRSLFLSLARKVHATSAVLGWRAGGSSDAALIPLGPVRLRYGAALQ